VFVATWQQRWREVRGHIHSRRAIGYCIASGLAVSLNWLTFIWR
jgi:EamA domain-containing membrane protein RarD